MLFFLLGALFALVFAGGLNANWIRSAKPLPGPPPRPALPPVPWKVEYPVVPPAPALLPPPSDEIESLCRASDVLIADVEITGSERRKGFRYRVDGTMIDGNQKSYAGRYLIAPALGRACLNCPGNPWQLMRIDPGGLHLLRTIAVFCRLCHRVSVVEASVNDQQPVPAHGGDIREWLAARIIQTAMRPRSPIVIDAELAELEERRTLLRLEKLRAEAWGNEGSTDRAPYRGTENDPAFRPTEND